MYPQLTPQTLGSAFGLAAVVNHASCNRYFHQRATARSITGDVLWAPTEYRDQSEDGQGATVAMAASTNSVTMRLHSPAAGRRDRWLAP